MMCMKSKKMKGVHLVVSCAYSFDHIHWATALAKSSATTTRFKVDVDAALRSPPVPVESPCGWALLELAGGAAVEDAASAEIDEGSTEGGLTADSEIEGGDEAETDGTSVDDGTSETGADDISTDGAPVDGTTSSAVEDSVG